MADDPSHDVDEREAEEDRIRADAEFVQRSSSASGGSKRSGTVTVNAATVSPTARVKAARGVALFYLVNEGPHAPGTIGSETSISTTQANHALSELYDRDLVELLRPEDASDGPVYGALPRGEQAAYYLLDSE